MKLSAKVLGSVSALVMAVAVLAEGWPCIFIFHQPKAPAAMKKLRKF